MRLGLHLSIGRGFKKTLQKATDLNCNALQIFSKNPRSWEVGPFDAEGAAYVKANKEAMGVAPWVVHVTYLINPATPDPILYEKSLQSLAIELKRSIALGAEYFVIHAGNRKGSSISAAIARLQKTIGLLTEKFGDKIKLLVENSTGKGTELGAHFDELATIVRPFPTTSVGICFDTCHAFSAGYDMRDEKSWHNTSRRLFDAIDSERLSLLHVNDSLGELASCIDRHTHLGEGEIGLAGFRAIFSDDRMRALPCILETPGRPEVEGIKNLNYLRKMKCSND